MSANPYNRRNVLARTAYAEAYLNNSLPNKLRPLHVTEILQARHDAGLMSPLEVMLAAMDRVVVEANKLAEQVDQARTPKLRGQLKAQLRQLALDAVDIAKDATPYCHPKLANMQLSGDAVNPLAMVVNLFDPDALRAKVRGGVIPLTLDHEEEGSAGDADTPAQ